MSGSNCTVKAIRTDYKGFPFRSRLEARWAIFFDTLGIEWDYEIEGYEFSDGTKYLPDFWFPHISSKDLGWGLWGEIKPFKATDEQLSKAIRLVRATKHNMLIFQGGPFEDKYTVTKISGCHFDPPKIIEGLKFIYDGSTGLRNNDGFTSYPCGKYFRDVNGIAMAHLAAKQARFEHGERPQP